jgi:hypothetical protein
MKNSLIIFIFYIKHALHMYLQKYCTLNKLIDHVLMTMASSLDPFLLESK